MKIRDIIVLVLAVVIVSCSAPQKKEVSHNGRKLRKISNAKLYKEVVANYLDYNTINIKKVNISYQDGDRKQTFGGSVRILKDSIIWLSISKLGIEGVRLKLTPDSVAFIDRLHREYAITDYSYLNDKFNVQLDFFLIQSIFTNQLPEYRISGDLPFFRNFRGRRSDTHYLFYSRQRRDRKYWEAQQDLEEGNRGKTLEILRINPDLMRLESVDIFETQFFKNKPQQIMNVNLKYGDYKVLNGNNVFPRQMEVNLKIEKKDIYNNTSEMNVVKLGIIMNHLDINPENLTFPFSISKKYKRIDV